MMLTPCKGLLIPEGYCSPLNVRQTEKAIKEIKLFFEDALSHALNLERISAPLFVAPETGYNDNLNGVERPVSFDLKDANGKVIEVVHSLAKWKRMALGKYGFLPGEGLYTDMDAIRRDEDMDNLHSIYVDQWDWELVIEKSQRTMETLKDVVSKIYAAIRDTERKFAADCGLKSTLPDEIKFITSQELLDLYPDLDAKGRENAIAKEYGAVFLMQIGCKLSNGEKHDGRAPDYDDWSLNGDILVWYDVLDRALELSSMGIRVDEEALEYQLMTAGMEERKSLKFHRDLLAGKLPYTIGGGIGQSRLCMFVLKKCHVGEVQASIWPDEMIEKCCEYGVHIL